MVVKMVVKQAAGRQSLSELVKSPRSAEHLQTVEHSRLSPRVR
jgi:hypothetical protein